MKREVHPVPRSRVCDVGQPGRPNPAVRMDQGAVVVQPCEVTNVVHVAIPVDFGRLDDPGRPVRLDGRGRIDELEKLGGLDGHLVSARKSGLHLFVRHPGADGPTRGFEEQPLGLAAGDDAAAGPDHVVPVGAKPTDPGDPCVDFDRLAVAGDVVDREPDLLDEPGRAHLDVPGRRVAGLRRREGRRLLNLLEQSVRKKMAVPSEVGHADLAAPGEERLDHGAGVREPVRLDNRFLTVLCSRRAVRTIVLASSLILPVAIATNAFAIGHVVGKGRSGIDRSEAVLAKTGGQTTATVRVRMTTDGKKAALLFPAPAKADGVRVLDDVSSLASLRSRTAPRFVVTEAPDPCDEKAKSSQRSIAWPEPAKPLAATYEIAHVPKNGVRALLAKHGLDVDAKVLRRIESQAVVVVIVTPKKRGRDRWTPGFQWRSKADTPLQLALGAAAVPAGREHRVTLYTIDDKKILAPPLVVNMPGPVAIAEVAIESPYDTASAIARHTIRRAKPGAWMQVHVEESKEGIEALGGPPGRHVLARHTTVASEKSASLGTPVPKTFVTAFSPGWQIRRKWRKKTSCSAPKLAGNVRIEQTAELRAYAALTGRQVADILERSTERGYTQRSDGTLAPVKPKLPPGAVER